MRLTMELNFSFFGMPTARKLLMPSLFTTPGTSFGDGYRSV